MDLSDVVLALLVIAAIVRVLPFLVTPSRPPIRRGSPLDRERVEMNATSLAYALKKVERTHAPPVE